MVEKPCFSYKLSCGAPEVITLQSHGADKLKLVIAEAGALQVLLFPGSGQLAPNCSAGWLSISGSDKLLHEPDSVQVLGTYFNIFNTYFREWTFPLLGIFSCAPCVAREHTGWIAMVH